MAKKIKKSLMVLLILGIAAFIGFLLYQNHYNNNFDDVDAEKIWKERQQESKIRGNDSDSSVLELDMV